MLRIVTLVFLFLTLTVVLLYHERDAFSEVDCLMCHDQLQKEKVVHPAIQMGCPTCHSAIDAKDIPHKKTNKIAKGLSAEQPDLCYNCHDKSKFTKKTIHPALGMGCTGCHNPHSSKNTKLLNSEPPELCYNCHDKKKFEGKTVHPPVMGGMCTSCHNPHSTDTPKLLASEPPQLCFNCHDQNKFKGNFIHSPVAGGMCMNCHFPHKSENEKLLQTNTPELCFNCHDKSEFTRKNVHPPVAGGMCASCHNPHATNFTSQLLKNVNDLCFDCHKNPDLKSGLHVVRGFTTGGHPVKGKVDPKRPGKEFSCASCHTPHSSDSIRLFRYKAQSLFELCVHCHEK